MKVLVVIPTYNEIESLPGALDRVRAAVPEANILVVDDSSPDGTGALADSRAGEDERIHVLHRKEKNGLGPAYLAGFSWALASGYELIVEMDADGSHRAEDLALLVQRAQMADEPDLVIGSRWVSGGATEGWDAKRVLLSRAGNLYINISCPFCLYSTLLYINSVDFLIYFYKIAYQVRDKFAIYLSFILALYFFCRIKKNIFKDFYVFKTNRYLISFDKFCLLRTVIGQRGLQSNGSRRRAKRRV